MSVDSRDLLKFGLLTVALIAGWKSFWLGWIRGYRLVLTMAGEEQGETASKLNGRRSITHFGDNVVTGT
jgi:hypothetical protein